MTKQNRQQGGSTFGFIIGLVIIGYIIFVGIQYAPQYIESTNVKTILDNLIDKNKKEPMGDMGAVQSAIAKQLNINQMDDLKSNFTVTQYRGDFVIKVSYERELDLLYTKKPMLYEKTITLD